MIANTLSSRGDAAQQQAGNADTDDGDDRHGGVRQRMREQERQDDSPLARAVRI